MIDVSALEDAAPASGLWLLGTDFLPLHMPATRLIYSCSWRLAPSTTASTSSTALLNKHVSNSTRQVMAAILFKGHNKHSGAQN